MLPHTSLVGSNYKSRSSCCIFQSISTFLFLFSMALRSLARFRGRRPAVMVFVLGSLFCFLVHGSLAFNDCGMFSVCERILLKSTNFFLAVITHPPSAVNSTVNSVDHFTCTATGTACDQYILDLLYQSNDATVNHSLNSTEDQNQPSCSATRCHVDHELVLEPKYHRAHLFCVLFSPITFQMTSTKLEPIFLICMSSTHQE